MYSAIIIADELLKRAKKEGRTLTPLQLMKLVYMAQGWSLAIRNNSLFPDRIEAWKYGPVIPDLYHATKQFGRNDIPLELVDDGETAVDADTGSLLDAVYKKYGKLSGIALSNLTHRSGTPWDQVYEDGVFGIEIQGNLIRDHYLSLINDERNTTAAT